jgi:hypothetical protein
MQHLGYFLRKVDRKRKIQEIAHSKLPTLHIHPIFAKSVWSRHNPNISACSPWYLRRGTSVRYLDIFASFWDIRLQSSLVEECHSNSIWYPPTATIDQRCSHFRTNIVMYIYWTLEHKAEQWDKRLQSRVSCRWSWSPCTRKDRRSNAYHSEPQHQDQQTGFGKNPCSPFCGGRTSATLSKLYLEGTAAARKTQKIWVHTIHNFLYAILARAAEHNPDQQMYESNITVTPEAKEMATSMRLWGRQSVTSKELTHHSQRVNHVKAHATTS